MIALLILTTWAGLLIAYVVADAMLREGQRAAERLRAKLRAGRVFVVRNDPRLIRQPNERIRRIH